MQGWLLLTFFICLHNQLSSLIPLSHRCMKNVIYQIDSKNEWLLLSITFTAKLELVFVLKFENAFPLSFHFKTNRKSIGSSKKRYQGFSKSPPFGRLACFYVAVSESFKHLQSFIFETDFLQNEKPFQKTGVPLFT